MFLGLLNPDKNKKPPFIYDVFEKDNVEIVRLKGDLDMSTIPNVEKMLNKNDIKRGYLKKSIILDFQRVKKVDSSTMAALLNILSYVKHEKNRLALINITKTMRKLIDLDKLIDVFMICDTEKDAMDYVRTKGKKIVKTAVKNKYSGKDPKK
jgi:anti-anti-sigma factor